MANHCPHRVRAILKVAGAGSIGVLLAAVVSACAGVSPAPMPKATVRGTAATSVKATQGKTREAVARPPLLRLTGPAAVRAPGNLTSSWKMVATVGGRVAAWAAQSGGATLLSFNQELVHLVLHAGTAEPGGGGWPHGEEITSGESHTVIAGFNGGFKLKLSNGSVGFLSGGHVGAPLRSGRGSIVTYTSGLTDIGAWHAGVPQPGAPIASVLQNLGLLVQYGMPAGEIQHCVLKCWGETLGGRAHTARSGLGITGTGQLVWAAGEQLTPAELAYALISAGAIRAVELDINPEWVAGYLYLKAGNRLSAAPLVPGQPGIPGQLFVPYNRDFFTVAAG
jgi:hypothetical protein